MSVISPETQERLVEVLLSEPITLGEAMEALDIDCDELELEDYLLTIGIEPCSACGAWNLSVESDDDEDDIFCLNCS